MWEDEDLENLDDYQVPLIEVDLEENDPGDHRGRGMLKPILIGVVGVIAVLAVILILRHLLLNPKEKDTSSEGAVIEETISEDDGQAMEGEEEIAPTPEPEPTPTPTPTPPPAPTPPPIPEQYLVPGLDSSDLPAVRDYIQTQLDAIAANLLCPNIDEIHMSEDGTTFTVICNSINESLAEQEAAEDIYELGRLYAAYAGTTVDNIHIDYTNRRGDLLWVRDSNNPA